MNKTYAVFGLGRYGQAVAKELINHGAEVIAVDIDEEIVNDAVSEIPFCKCADVTDIEVIKQLGIANVDVVIIAMADSLEASVMATMLCKEVGVEKVIVKCGNDMNCRILEKIGADKVVFPEMESGVRLAKILSVRISLILWSFRRTFQWLSLMCARNGQGSRLFSLIFVRGTESILLRYVRMIA
ncbi:MAG: TrkA family potassium uptake protein [Oscillospiraceae bacterium]|nr:TrkA family potassium uptake protein [Oscillospiraceae bacterium]